MENHRSTDGKRRFSPESMRILKDARDDPNYALLKPDADLQLLAAFLERMDRLGWIPPLNAERRRLLREYGVIMHVVTDELCFYEY